MKPILFNTEMVKAILAGRKTVTRRVVKSPTARIATGPFLLVLDEKDHLQLPPYQVGDILYVRETFCKNGSVYFYKAGSPHLQDNMYVRWHPSLHMPREAARIFLRVTDVRVERLQSITEEQVADEGYEPKCPFEHRTWVGSPYENGHESMCWCEGDCHNPEKWCDKSCPELFGEKLWDSTIKKADIATYGWEANPWVWVIEFERITGEAAGCLK